MRDSAENVDRPGGGSTLSSTGSSGSSHLHTLEELSPRLLNER